jgi:hypothetical protein
MGFGTSFVSTLLSVIAASFHRNASSSLAKDKPYQAYLVIMYCELLGRDLCSADLAARATEIPDLRHANYLICSHVVVCRLHTFRPYVKPFAQKGLA